MRKALLSSLLVVVLILMILIMKNGFSIGSLRVYGFDGINKKNEDLTSSIAAANTQNDNYTNALSKLQTDVEALAVAKKNYLDAISQNTESEIRQATQTKTYTIEYLWSRIGNYATAQGITLEMQVSNSTLQNQDYKNLNFTAQGEYLAIVQFMYDLENDSNLDFTIDSFHMTQNRATFVVKDVKIQRENSTVAPSTTTTTTTTETNTSENTTTDTASQTSTESENSNVTETNEE